MNSTDTSGTQKKTDSRKFIVWLVWLIIAIAVGIYTFITKEPELLENTLDHLFVISMMYLGVNVGQKGVLAIADAIKHKYSTKEEKRDE
jgi:uncharacterized membrane protein YfcA